MPDPAMNFTKGDPSLCSAQRRQEERRNFKNTKCEPLQGFSEHGGSGMDTEAQSSQAF